MGKPSLATIKFMEAYGVYTDEVWEVRAGGAWAIKHAALERIAAERNITFDLPELIENSWEHKAVVIRLVARLGERTEWTFGEATPSNNKNAYVYAMAEKRAKDRLILKLLNAHGALYSDAEADDFADSGNGKPTTLPKKDAKEIYTKMQTEVRAATSRDHLKIWMEANKDRILVLPEDWQDILRLQCEEMLADLRQREAAA
jgi:hypothetical protein